MFRLRDREIAKAILKKIKQMNVKLHIMHVCGTHQDTIVRFGLDDLLPKHGIKIIQGPGCPVCVTTPKEIEKGIKLAESGVTIATFGDMVRVPGMKSSLESARSKGKDIRIVYSIHEAVEIAKKGKEVVFMAVGFETTAPSTASILLHNPPENFSILSCHRFIPPAVDAILGAGEILLDGLLEPGHVSTIIGVKAYEEISKKYKIPQVIAGFEPLDVLMGIWMIAKQVKEGRHEIENEYTRCVRYDGNKKALDAIHKVFKKGDARWRGFPIIEKSKMVVRDEFDEYDAEKKYEEILEELDNMEIKEPPGCRCGDVLRGIIEAKECPLFGKKCVPSHPIGPCMVSTEGACNIEYRYKK
ncbi:MAG: hydrogenase formation protein HypD [Thermoplasmata archaeon]|nr:MAG: hydrogenase formation protein HypD [Thermoplasmata archaeon]